jgi:DNA polymerase-3 subunit epsilon
MLGVTYLDVETTGLYPKTDRVIQVSLRNDSSTLTLLVNPQQDISKEAMAVHNITNEMVASQPTFKDICQSLIPFFDIATCKYICGYNVAFDFKFMQMEFSRCNLFLESSSYKFLDPLAIHKKLCPNDLASMYRRYTGKELIKGHDAEVDMIACLEILEEQQKRTKKDLGELSELSDLNNKTIGGWLERTDKGYIFLMGKHKGEELTSVTNKDKSYIDWLLQAKDISFEEQLIIRGVAYA